MLNRRTTKTLAEVMHEIFRGSFATSQGGRRYELQKDYLYDFLYEQGYDAWFLNAAHHLYKHDVRALKEFIMKLHTGETVQGVTPNWNWQQRAKLGQRLLRDLAEDTLILAQSPTKNLSEETKRQISRLISELELDGYIFRDGKLYFTEAAVLDTENEEGILEKLINDLALENQDVMKHTLTLSATHYSDNKWDDSIANSRRFLESVLQEIASKHHTLGVGRPISRNTYEHPFEVRNYLESQGLVEPKEKEAIAKVYGLMSDTGSHPYIAHKDQARLMRYLALTFAQFALLRLQGALPQKV